MSLIVSQALLKTLYEIIVLPITIIVVKRLRRYNPLPDELY